MKHKCIVCGYIYSQDEGDPLQGVDAGTQFNDIPVDWLCPVCFATKEYFAQVDEL